MRSTHRQFKCVEQSVMGAAPRGTDVRTYLQLAKEIVIGRMHSGNSRDTRNRFENLLSMLNRETIEAKWPKAESDLGEMCEQVPGLRLIVEVREICSEDRYRIYADYAGWTVVRPKLTYPDAPWV